MTNSDQLSDQDRQLDLADAEFTILVSQTETNGAFSLLEATVEPGAETSSHWHRETMEAFYVLEGSLTITIDGDARTVRSGESFFVPPRTVHAPVNPGGDVCRHLLLLSPGTFEGFFRERARAYAAPDSRPPDAMASAQDVFERYDVHEPPVDSPRDESRSK